MADVPLTDRMRRSTRTVHDTSDKLVGVKLAVAFTDRQLYGTAISFFYYIFQQIEIALERNIDHEHIAPFADLLPQCARTAGFEKDLEYYLGEDYLDRISPTPAVAMYLKHLNHIEDSNPTLLLAYMYHMYMAILAGGQIIKKMARRTMNLPKDQGTALLDVAQGVNRGILRKRIKERLNALVLDKEMEQALLDESSVLFALNNKVVAGLQGKTVSMSAIKTVSKLVAYAAVVLMVLFQTYQWGWGSMKPPAAKL